MISSLLLNFYNFYDEQKEVSAKNKEKLEEIKQLYHKAKDFPRKKKKSVRNKCIEDYNFFYSISKWHEDFLNGKLTF